MQYNNYSYTRVPSDKVRSADQVSIVPINNI